MRHRQPRQVHGSGAVPPLVRWMLAVVSAVLLVVPATSAAAHDTLVSTDPADGAVLTAPPAQVVLTFSDDQIDVGAAVSVTGPDGSGYASGPPVVSGATVTQALLPDLPAGGYTVRWRSVSADGHPLEGTSTFALQLPAEPEASPTPAAPSPATTPSAGEDATGDEATPAPATTAGPTVGPGPGASTTDGGGPASDAWGWLLAGLAAVVVAAVVVAVAVRRQAGRDE